MSSPAYYRRQLERLRKIQTSGDSYKKGKTGSRVVISVSSGTSTASQALIVVLRDNLVVRIIVLLHAALVTTKTKWCSDEGGNPRNYAASSKDFGMDLGFCARRLGSVTAKNGFNVRPQP